MPLNEVNSLVGQPQKIEFDVDNKKIVLNYIPQHCLTLGVIVQIFHLDLIEVLQLTPHHKQQVNHDSLFPRKLRIES